MKSTLVDNGLLHQYLASMTNQPTTRDRLLTEGQRLFWSRGYCNVSVRDIAQAAGVDVALISRYFGSKLGLFEATLELIEPIEPAAHPNAEALVESLVRLCADWPRGEHVPSTLTHLLVNGNDPDVGDIVRASFAQKWQDPLTEATGDPRAAALLSAAALGMSVAEKTLRLGGVTDPADPGYEPALRRFFAAALKG